MNIRSFMMLGTVMALGLSACIIESSSGGSSGNTTNGAGGSSGDGGADPTGGTGGAGGGSAQCDENATCTEAITEGGDPNLLCDGPHGDLYDAYQACVCSGACAVDCGNADRCSSTGVKEQACEDCLLDTSAAGCGKEQQACANDQ
jgi:hypothetical protein